jgi:hypothetical protein
MQRIKLNCDKLSGANKLILAAIAVGLTAGYSICAMAQQVHQKTFSSPEEACIALVTAAQKNDERAMLDILGPEGAKIVSSGDEAEDAESRARFVERYQQMHRLVREENGATVLYIGAENWPTPIPLMNSGSVWYFDTEAGKKEILYRRVGRNEISAITVCQELVAAQKEYYAAQHNEYAHKIFSDEGQHNGLYWKAGDGEAPSPIGPLVAAAFVVSGQTSSPVPFRGYYYRMLRSQGDGAAGGSKKYVENGRMTGGFAFVAYPAEYKSSGVMTFVVNNDGIVYQQDLGGTTSEVAREMKEYAPNTMWEKAEDQQDEETADNQKTK